ncbi:MAG: hypothetical protein C9355_07655 [Thalassolituus maritimus]|nr:MAG: hypothetical protein C9355_07655 [Thalassolituus maritimus]
MFSGLLKNLCFGISKTVILLPVLATPALADVSWSEPDDNMVVARWSKEELKPLPQTHAQRMDEIKKHFEHADKPGESWRYDRIYVLMDGLESESGAVSDVPADELTYYRARLLQHRHEFARAASLLQKIDSDSAYYGSARLMMAQVYGEQNQQKAAREACLSLVLEQTDLAAVCSIALQATAGPAGHGILTALLERLSDDDSPQGRSLSAWALYQKSKSYLNEGKYAEVEALYQQWSVDARLSVADLVHRSEALLRNKQPEKVMALLQDYGSANYPDDAIIVQLARAEQQSGSTELYWRDYAEERISQRIKRRDQSYSELISLYFSTVGKNAESRNLSWLSQVNNAHRHQFIAVQGDIL